MFKFQGLDKEGIECTYLVYEGFFFSYLFIKCLMIAYFNHSIV